MPVPLPQLQPKSYAPKPALPFAEPPPKTPISFRQPKGVKPGQITSPYRITKLGPPPPPAVGAGAAASGAGAAKALLRLPKAGLAAVAFELLFPPPAGDNYYDRNPKNPPAKYKLQPPEPVKELEPPQFQFKGGQSEASYHIVGIARVSYRRYFEFRNPPLGKPFTIDFDYDTRISGSPVPGKILGIDSRFGSGFLFGGSGGGFGLFVSSSQRPTDPYGVTPHRTTVVSEGDGPFNYNQMSENKVISVQIIEAIRADGQPDTGGNPPPSNNPSYSAPGNSLGAPLPAPPGAAPSSAPKAPSPFGSPSSSPGGSPSGSPSSSPGGSPSGSPSSSPSGSPSSSQSKGPSPFPSPAPAPNPGPQPQLQRQKQPEPQPEPFPFAEPAPKPGLNLFAPPGNSPAPTPAPTPSPQPNSYRSPPLADPTKYPDTGFQPNIFQPKLLSPNPLEPKNFTPNPKTGNPEPKAPPLILPSPRSEDPKADPNENLGKQIQAGVGILTGLLAGVTALVQPDKLINAAKEGSCRSFEPGQCNAPISQNAADAARNSANNSSALAALMAFLQALQAVFLVPIKAGIELANTKLGPLLAGANGISGFLGRLSSSLGIDRALNLIAIAANLHNAMMLSANLKITLLEMLSSVGNATGLLQTSENENVDLNQVFNAGIETFLISILGVDSYAGLKVGLRKYNAIYQAATNSLNAVSSMFNSLGNVVEQGAEYTGRIGNSLKGAGIVAENAYRWMSEKFDTKSNKFIKFQSTIGDVTQVLETINEIAETVVEGQQSATEFQKANTDFIKAVEDAKKGTPPENKEVLAEAAKAKENATKDPTGEIETGLLSFLSN